MSMTYAQGRDEILTTFKTAWDAGVESAGILVIYPDAKNQVPQGNDANNDPLSWARVSVEHVAGFQSTLAGEDGNKIFTRLGLLTVQIFTPRGGGLSLGDSLYKIVVDAFEGKRTANGAWFKNVRINEIGPSGEWWQTNVIVEFEYDELK